MVTNTNAHTHARARAHTRGRTHTRTPEAHTRSTPSTAHAHAKHTTGRRSTQNTTATQQRNDRRKKKEAQKPKKTRAGFRQLCHSPLNRRIKRANQLRVTPIKRNTTNTGDNKRNDQPTKLLEEPNLTKSGRHHQHHQRNTKRPQQPTSHQPKQTNQRTNQRTNNKTQAQKHTLGQRATSVDRTTSLTQVCPDIQTHHTLLLRFT